MPLNLPDKLPAVEQLRQENIFVMARSRAAAQDIRPLRIAVLNLMPLKIQTETDLVRLLSNSPLQVELTFLSIGSHASKNTPAEHMQAFYKPFASVREERFDGMIVTGAPLEHLDYEQVAYWQEMTQVFDWARTHVTSVMHICWAAQAALYHYYNVPKYPLAEKLFGVFGHTAADLRCPLFRGFDDRFDVPHSRHSEVRKEDLLNVPGLSVLSESGAAGVYVVLARKGREIYVTGHSEYAPLTLDAEYKRDRAKGLPIALPRNYYRGDDPSAAPVVRWRAHANLLFSNWLNYYVYQETPYDSDEIGG